MEFERDWSDEKYEQLSRDRSADKDAKDTAKRRANDAGKAGKARVAEPPIAEACGDGEAGCRPERSMGFIMQTARGAGGTMDMTAPRKNVYDVGTFVASRPFRS